MSRIGIRQATLADLAQIIALDQEIFGAYGAQESPQVIRARLEVFPAGCAILTKVHRSNDFSRSGGGGTTEVVTTGTTGSFLGYLTTEKWADAREPALDEDPYVTHKQNGRVLCITTLAVAPAFQNQGLGKHLLDHAIQIAQEEGCEQIVLETARAKRFYLRHGFELVGTRKERGILLYIMRLLVQN